ncbi:MAG: hypothetical protein ACM357_10055 [Gemmatimonadota bacterium]
MTKPAIEGARPPTPWRWSIMVAAGAGPGWWMFHYRGAALFAAVGLAIGLGVMLGSRHAPRLTAVGALLGAALALHASSTLGWAGTDVPDGSRFKASPVGLSHVLTPHRPESATVDCGWHAASGYPAPCAVADSRAFARLRLVYPLVLTAALLAAAGMALSLSRAALVSHVRRGLASAAALGTIGALGLFATSVRPALAAIADLPVGVGGTLGTMQVALAFLLLLAAALSPGARSAATPETTRAIAAEPSH